jgi:hypothetical protein
MMQHVVLAIFLCACFAVPLRAQQPAGSGGQTYQLKPTPKTVVWGYYDGKSLPPVSEIPAYTTPKGALVSRSTQNF